MQIPVLVERVSGGGYRAREGLFALSAEGTTRREALDNLRGLVEARMAAGAELMGIEVGPPAPAWAKVAGSWAGDDPRLDEWERAVEDYRRKVDEDPDAW
jgi:hypothetical protein